MKKIYPVIHVETQDQALANLEIAVKCQADGVFLISHSLGYKTLDYIHGACVVAHPHFFIGINFLDLDPLDAVDMMVGQIPALWTDNAGISEDQEEQNYAAKVWNKIADDNWQGLYFGGVAFKYQKPVQDLEKVCKIAANYMDVAITSGPGTGKAADVSKLMTMKSALSQASKPIPLAVASGITVENVMDYKDCVDIFLVATGISKDFLNLDEEKVKALVDKVRIM